VLPCVRRINWAWIDIRDIRGQNSGLAQRLYGYGGSWPAFCLHTAQIWMKIDPYTQQQKCRPMTLVSENIRYMQILAGVPLGGDLKREWGCWRRQFLAIWVATSSETSEIRPATLYDDMLPLVGLWLIEKWMTSNDLEWLFHVKCGFCTSSFWFWGFDFEA